MGRAVLRRGRRVRPQRLRARRTRLTSTAGGPRPLARYRGQPLAIRGHVALRWLACPFPLVEREVPPTGRILDVGTGHGLFAVYLASCAEGREVHGIDIDQDKLVAARAAAASSPALHNVTFSSGSAGAGPSDAGDDTYDAIVIVDVLYLLDPSHQETLVKDLAARLRPGGRLVVKESAEEPRWKLGWSKAEEVLATRVFHVTQSTDTGLPFTAPAAMAAWMAGAGLAVEQRSIDRHYPYPHHLVVGTAPADESRTNPSVS